MEYGLLPAEAALSFVIILYIIYSKKQQFRSTKTILFKMYLRFLIFYMCMLFISIVFLKYFGEGIVFVVMWRITHIFLVCSWFTFLYYSYTNIFDIKKERFKEIITYNFITKFALMIMIVLCLFFMVPVFIPLLDHHSQIDPSFLSKPQSIITLVITILSNISIIVCLLNFVPKGNRLRLLPNVLAGLFAIPFAGMHIFCLETALYPLSFSVIAYILYFSYENPDILLLNETKQIDDEEESKVKNKFLESFNEDSLNEINDMLVLCEKFKNIDETNINEFKSNLKLISKKCIDSLEEINNALNESQIKTEINVVKSQKYEVKELINSIIRYTQDKIGDRKLKLHVNISPTLSSELYGDYEKLEQILKNIISFSVSNVRLGRITISVGSEKKDGNELLSFKIVDTGDGLEKEAIDNLFTSNDERMQGLKIVDSYIKNLNGKIMVNSEYKIGTSFLIQLNQKIANSSVIDFNASKSLSTFDINGDNSKYKILIVDDNSLNAKITERILRKYNFNVEVISSGNDCIRKIKLEETFDMILMDIMMGEVDGIETLKSIRELVDYKLPPIIALTANALSGMKDDYLNNGFDDYLEKPLKSSELIRIFNKFF